MSKGLLKNTITLLQGSVPAQLVPILAYPFLLFFYSPSDFGQYGYFLPATLTLGMVANLGFDIILQLAKQKEAAMRIYLAALRISTLFSLLCAGLIWPFAEKLADVTAAPMLSVWLYVLPLSIWLEAQIHSLSQYLSHSQQYKGLSAAIFTQSIAATAVSFAWGYVEGTAHGLFAGLVLGQLAKALIMFLSLQKHLKATHQAWKGVEGIWSTAKESLQMSLYTFAATLLNLISRNSVIPLLNFFFGTQVGGYITLSIQILQLPNRFLIGTLSQVYYQRIAQWRQSSGLKVREETRGALLILLIGSAIPCVILSVIGPELLAAFFGDKWLASGHYLKYLLAWSIVAAVVAPLTDVFLVKSKEKGYFWFNLGMMLLRIGSLVLGGYLLSEEETINLFGWVAFASSGLMLLWIMQLNGILIGKKAFSDQENRNES